MNSFFRVHNIKLSLKLQSPFHSYFKGVILKNNKIKQKNLVIFGLYIVSLLMFFSIHQQIFYTVMSPKSEITDKFSHPKKN